MKYNKKLINDEKNNGNFIKHNAIIFNNLKHSLNYNKKNYNNKRMKKSFSQVNFNEKKIDRTENEKTAYSKNKSKSNKYFSPIDNQKSICFMNNKSINNNSKNSSNITKLNNKKNISNNKFRYVLDKYVISQKKPKNKRDNGNRQISEKNKKEEEKSRNNIENEKQQYKIQKSTGINKYDFDKKENSKMVTTKKNEENILSNVENNINKKKEQTQESFFNDEVYLKIPKESENVLKYSNETNNLEENNDRVNTLCNDLGSNTNIKELINLPFYITPKYSNNISNNDSLNKIKNTKSYSGNNSSSLIGQKKLK